MVTNKLVNGSIKNNASNAALRATTGNHFAPSSRKPTDTDGDKVRKEIQNRVVMNTGVCRGQGLQSFPITMLRPPK